MHTEVNMSYTNKNLMPGEKVVYKANIHWFVFIPSILLLVFSIYLIASAPSGKDGLGLTTVGTLIIFVSLWKFAKALIYKMSTELAVTNKRVIAKVGLIKRNTIELNHSKVESYAVNQPIFGRIFDYGSITITGTGGVKNPIPNIDSPILFRNAAVGAVDDLQSA